MSSFFGENSPTWTGMSDYVVHFAKDYQGRKAYDNMLGILSNRVIRARNPFGIARTKAPDIASQKAVCFSEVPLHLLGRLADKRSEYGVGFGKAFVIHRKGNPILYAYKDQSVATAIQKLVAAFGDDTDSPIWEVTPFIDMQGAYPNGSYFFEWEREWRKSAISNSRRKTRRSSSFQSICTKLPGISSRPPSTRTWGQPMTAHTLTHTGSGTRSRTR